VITKADLADAARLREVHEEIEILADGTCLEGSPIIAVSAPGGRGIDQLRDEIERQLEGFAGRRATGLFRLPLDRAFVMKGHGAVVTGTAMGAEVRLGQKLRLLPAGAEVRVRGIQVHGEPVEQAGLSQRVALNLSGAEKLDLKRGDVLTDERLELATARLDAWLEVRPAAKRAVKHNQRVRFFIGAAETIGRVIVLGEPPQIEPKQRALVQLVLDDSVVALAGDRFVMRDETNVRTLGGGGVLNPLGRNSRRPLDVYIGNLKALGERSGPTAVEAMLNLQERLALTAPLLAQLFNAPAAEIAEALKDPRFIRLSLGDEEGFTTASRWNEIKRVAIEAVTRHHRDEPLAPGIEMEALRTRLPYEVAPRAFRALLDRLARESELVREESVLRLKSHRVQLGGDTGELGAQVERILHDANYQPPDLKQLAEALALPPSSLPRLRAVLSAIEREGRVIKIASDFYMARAAFESAREKLLERLQRDGEISAATYRDVLDASRKFAILLLDHFDHSGVTTRVGDLRKLRAR
jgi:selenocysteine-specific elongation factor